MGECHAVDLTRLALNAASYLNVSYWADISDLSSIILETDSTAIASRCSRPRPDPALNLSELKIDEQVRRNSNLRHIYRHICLCILTLLLIQF